MTVPGVRVRVRGYDYYQDGGGSGSPVVFTPTQISLTDPTEFAYIQTATHTVYPDPVTGYFYADLIATNDPNLTPFLWRVTFDGRSFFIDVDYQAAVVNVGGGLMLPALWLTEAASPDNVPPNPTAYYTSTQTDSRIGTAIGAHNVAGDSHGDLRALIAAVTAPVTSVNTRTGAVVGLAEQSALAAHTGDTTNPHAVTKAQVGLGNADNTSDASKPLSSAATTALAAKAADSAVVHNTGVETIAGAKTFSSPPVVPAPGAAGNPVRNDDSRLSDSRTPILHTHGESDVTSLVSDLAGKVPLSTVTTKGDMIVATGAGAVIRLPVTVDGQSPVTDTTQAGGWKLATPAAGGGLPTPTIADEGRTPVAANGVYTLTADSGRTPLKRFRQILAANGTTNLNWWAIGDSITEGSVAGAVDLGYVPRVSKALQKRFTDAGKGGFGYLSTGVLVPPSTVNFWSFSGAGGMTNTLVPWGGKLWGAAVGETGTLTFVGTSFILAYRQGDASSVPFTVTIDGGAPVTVTPSTTGGISVRGQYTSPGLTSATHTALCAPVNPAQTMKIYGATIFDGDETGGIRCYNHAYHGTTTTTWLASYGTSFADQQFLAPNPALVSIHLGSNDYGLNVDPALTITNLQTIIANVKAACTIIPSFLLILPHQNNYNPTPAFPWASYVTSIKQVAAADPNNVAILDTADHFIDIPAPSTTLIASDSVHPTKAGHRFMAQLVLNRLVGAHGSLV